MEVHEQEVVFKDKKRALILACTTLLIIIIIISGIFVYFFTNEYISKIVLWMLFSLIILIGLSMIIYIEYQKRQAYKRKNLIDQPFPPRKSNERGWVRSISTLEGQYVRPVPSAPKLSIASGWALKPRKWSVATTAFVPSSPQPTFGTVI